jgi:membrane protease subunit HflC
MNGNLLRTGLLVLLGVAAVVLYASTFVVSQTQQALVLQFGRVRTVATRT